MTEPSLPSTHFSAILASSIHDIKNSITHVRGLISQLSKNQGYSDTPELQQLEQEANRMNSSLVQLLILYRIDSALFKPTIEEYSALEILEDIAAQYQNLLTLSHIELQIHCTDEIFCYCDDSLISSVLASIVNNAQRCCRRKIAVSVYTVEHFTCFCVEDDGAGYPEQILADANKNFSESDFSAGNTGLGLYFAAIIARLHHNGDRMGYIKIENSSHLGGAKFSLFLP